MAAAALKDLNCNPKAILPQGSHKTTVTREASVRSRPDTIWVHDTILSKIYLKAQANRTINPSSSRDSLPSSISDSLPHSRLSCLDSLWSSGDTSASGPDTISICHDEASDIFYLDLRFSPRERTLAAPFIHTDSIITLRDSTTVTQQAPSSPMKNFWDSLLSGIESIGLFIAGFLVGKVIP